MGNTQTFKQGDIVRLTNPLSNGQIVRIESVDEYGKSEGKSGIRHLIKYDDDSAAFLAYKLPLNEFDNGCHIENDWVVKFCKKVVGNIFDNPELIKKGGNNA